MLPLTPHNKTYISPPAFFFFFFTFIHFYLINLNYIFFFIYISNFNVIIISQLLHKTRNCVINYRERKKERKRKNNPHTLALISTIAMHKTFFQIFRSIAHPMNLGIKFQFHLHSVTHVDIARVCCHRGPSRT